LQILFLATKTKSITTKSRQHICTPLMRVQWKVTAFFVCCVRQE
jgi:hypothetical protein